MSLIASVSSWPPGASHSGAAIPQKRIVMDPSSMVSPSRTQVTLPVSEPWEHCAAAGRECEQQCSAKSQGLEFNRRGEQMSVSPPSLDSRLVLALKPLFFCGISPTDGAAEGHCRAEAWNGDGSV